MHRLKEFPPIRAMDHISSSAQSYADASAVRIDVICVSAAVFRMLHGRSHILLLQRAESDSLPGRWELPGGAIDSTDATIKDALGRELKEETGLTLAWIVQEAGRPQLLSLGKQRRRYVKLSFVVEVDEIGCLEYPKRGQNGAEVQSSSSTWVPVVLRPSEHQKYLWVDRQGVRDLQVDGTSLHLTSDKTTQDILLQAFDIQDAVLAARHEAAAVAACDSQSGGP